MRTQIKILLMAASLCLTTGCNPVEFNQMKSELPSVRAVEPFPDPDIPVVDPSPTPTPPVVVVPTPAPTPVVVTPPTPVPAVLSKGMCAADSSTRLLSCLTCVVPTVPPVAQFSRKGQALFDIMTAACQVRNGSDPASYVPPTRADLLRRMNRLSPTLYPDSPMSAIETSTINSLVTNPNEIRRMFDGVFYSGVRPETRAFETYFGLEVIEARYAFCYAGPSAPEGSSNTFDRFNSTPLHSKEWIDCQYGQDPFSCTENATYQAANVYRNQLRRGMTESIVNPYVPPAPIPAQTCEWEKFEGLYDAKATAQIQTWLDSGFTVAGDVPSLGMCLQVREPLANVIGTVSLAAYRCR